MMTYDPHYTFWQNLALTLAPYVGLLLGGWLGCSVYDAIGRRSRRP
jgi:hypothetical protein